MAGARREPAGAADRDARRHRGGPALRRHRPLRRQGPVEVGQRGPNSGMSSRSGRFATAISRPARSPDRCSHARASATCSCTSSGPRHGLSGTSQGRGNSGVIFMGRYEVQVLDIVQEPDLRRRRRRLALRPVAAAGQRAAAARRVADLRHRLRGAAIRGGQAGEAGVCDGDLEWRARAAPEGAGRLDHRTGANRNTRRTPRELPLTLQDHSNPVRYRNVWVQEAQAEPLTRIRVRGPSSGEAVRRYG